MSEEKSVNTCAMYLSDCLGMSINGLCDASGWHLMGDRHLMLSGTCDWPVGGKVSYAVRVSPKIVVSSVVDGGNELAVLVKIKRDLYALLRVRLMERGRITLLLLGRPAGVMQTSRDVAIALEGKGWPQWLEAFKYNTIGDFVYSPDTKSWSAVHVGDLDEGQSAGTGAAVEAAPAGSEGAPPV